MSERLRQAYLKQWEKELTRRVRLKNKRHLDRQHAAGEKWQKRYAELKEAGLLHPIASHMER